LRAEELGITDVAGLILMVKLDKDDPLCKLTVTLLIKSANKEVDKHWNSRYGWGGA
jgi:hypothetical protein